MNKKKRELEQNELADALGTKLDELKPHIPRIAMFSGVAILGIIAVAYWWNVRQGINEDRWREYFVSARYQDPRGFKTVAELFPDTTVGSLALINAADAEYATGAVNMVRNRETYTTQVKQAIEDYEVALQSDNVDDFARARATYALGYAYESIGRFDDAQKMYEEVIDKLPDSPESELAQKALNRVTDSSLTAIYAAFKEWAPPTETAPGDAGAFLPPRPNISMPPESTDDDAADEDTADENSGDEDSSDENADDDAPSPDNETSDDESGDDKDSDG